MGFEIRPYQDTDIALVVDLWEQCDVIWPQNDSHEDIAAKIVFQPELFLVAELDGQLIGTVMVGYEGHRGWLNYLAVDPDHRRQGYGRKLVEAAENRLKDMGCPKVNLQIRTSNKQAQGFYNAVGYVTEDRISMGKRF